MVAPLKKWNFPNGTRIANQAGVFYVLPMVVGGWRRNQLLFNMFRKLAR